jgi:hypothetical protein
MQDSYLRNRIHLRAMIKESAGQWCPAVILSVTRKEISFLLMDSPQPTGAIRLVIAGSANRMKFRAVCSAKVNCVMTDSDFGNALEVRAQVRSWELIKPKQQATIGGMLVNYLA